MHLVIQSSFLIGYWFFFYGFLSSLISSCFLFISVLIQVFFSPLFPYLQILADIWFSLELQFPSILLLVILGIFMSWIVWSPFSLPLCSGFREMVSSPLHFCVQRYGLFYKIPSPRGTSCVNVKKSIVSLPGGFCLWKRGVSGERMCDVWFLKTFFCLTGS